MSDGDIANLIYLAAGVIFFGGMGLGIWLQIRHERKGKAKPHR